ncbi:ATP adenylyltransferase [Dacryopinax primogenitus]|uniref:ATP adenylyltransferase n=1 Tax=Dacryopinax primogenitus (strain DJM 731) TaxID=1858805 RepID=M5G0T7_DACPD|nr:ATP adenylyltransferase [Dacryopinax primogenitus]EJT97407.1 ATP adenylyltransferase [Dacryopinax primogenitus]
MPTYTAEELVKRVPSCTKEASESGDLLYFPSDQYTYEENGIAFRIRHCPALLHKPVLPIPDFTQSPVEKKDPFAPPYVEKLVIGALDGGEGESQYVALLNKYSVVPNHFLLVTKEYESQGTPPSPGDLVATYSLLQAAHRVGREIFAFYNCGEQSGASQHHKHLQFLSEEEDGLTEGPPIERLAHAAHVLDETRPFALSQLPYAHYVYRLPSSAASSQPQDLEHILSRGFIHLLDLVFDTLRRQPEPTYGSVSYNVLITLRHIHIIPRMRETHKLRETGDELSINALGFAGMLLVKSERELDAVRKEGVSVILRGVGCAPIRDAELAPQITEPAEEAS